MGRLLAFQLIKNMIWKLIYLFLQKMLSCPLLFSTQSLILMSPIPCSFLFILLVFPKISSDFKSLLIGLETLIYKLFLQSRILIFTDEQLFLLQYSIELSIKFSKIVTMMKWRKSSHWNSDLLFFEYQLKMCHVLLPIYDLLYFLNRILEIRCF